MFLQHFYWKFGAQRRQKSPCDSVNAQINYQSQIIFIDVHSS